MRFRFIPDKECMAGHLSALNTTDRTTHLYKHCDDYCAMGDIIDSDDCDAGDGDDDGDDDNEHGVDDLEARGRSQKPGTKDQGPEARD